MGIVAVISTLSFVSFQYWNVQQHGMPIPTIFGVTYQTYVMRHSTSDGNYISFEYVDPPIGNQSVIINNPSEVSLHDCVAYKSNGSNKIIITRLSTIKQNSTLFSTLNNTSEGTIYKIHFSCKDPKFDISWPNFVLDKKDYKHSDALTLSGILSPSSNVQISIFEPIGASNLVHNMPANPYASQNINADPNGNFSFSYDIPSDQANGKWVIGVKSGDDEYYFMFRVDMPSGSF